MGWAILWAWERKQSLSTFTYFTLMRSLAIYFGFMAVAVSITTYTVDGMRSGLEAMHAERNAQVEAILSR